MQIQTQVVGKGQLDLGALTGYTLVPPGEYVVAFYLDLPSKACVLEALISSPGDYTRFPFLPLNAEGEVVEGAWTELIFPAYKGWGVHAYTQYGDELAITLFKPAYSS